MVFITYNVFKNALITLYPACDLFLKVKLDHALLPHALHFWQFIAHPNKKSPFSTRLTRFFCSDGYSSSFGFLLRFTIQYAWVQWITQSTVLATNNLWRLNNWWPTNEWEKTGLFHRTHSSALSFDTETPTTKANDRLSGTKLTTPDENWEKNDSFFYFSVKDNQSSVVNDGLFFCTKNSNWWWSKRPLINAAAEMSLRLIASISKCQMHGMHRILYYAIYMRDKRHTFNGTYTHMCMSRIFTTFRLWCMIRRS